MTTLEDAMEQMVSFGLDVDIPVIDGKIHRVNYQSEKKKSGWYVLHRVDNLIAGRFGSWKTDDKGYQIKRRVTVEVDKKSLQRARVESEKRLEEKRKLYQEAELKALSIWEDSQTEGSSAYLDKKKIEPFGARFFGSFLVIPMVREGKIRSLQSISASGFKKFMKNGNISGCYYLIEGSGKLALVEGFATGASVHMATGWNVAICFSASNLIKAAPYFRKKDCIICADNDEAGLKYGALAAKELSCEMKVAEFGDFNDVHVKHGLEAVKECLI